MLVVALPDKEPSLTDSISFVIKERERIDGALTGDRDFEPAGFQALLKASAGEGNFSRKSAFIHAIRDYPSPLQRQLPNWAFKF